MKFGPCILDHYAMDKRGTRFLKKIMELGMTVGAPISLLGNITINISEEKVRIDHPLILAANKSGI